MMVDLIEKISKGHGSRFPCVFQTDFFLIHQQLEAKEKAVVNLIFPNHFHQSFGLLVYLCTDDLTELSCDLLFGAFLCGSDTGLGTALQAVYLPVTVLGDKLTEVAMHHVLFLWRQKRIIVGCQLIVGKTLPTMVEYKVVFDIFNREHINHS